MKDRRRAWLRDPESGRRSAVLLVVLCLSLATAFPTWQPFQSSTDHHRAATLSAHGKAVSQITAELNVAPPGDDKDLPRPQAAGRMNCLVADNVAGMAETDFRLHNRPPPSFS